ncbi:hypothetical protein JNUCC64_09695 [Streptomyces sp. JNUCC 64]
MVVARLAGAVLGTWTVLLLAVLAPSALLPTDWHYYVYSPASVGLWVLTMLIGPPVVCFAVWPWIRNGGGEGRG